MSKVLPATCTANVVTADDLALPGAVVLSEGIGPSEGFAVIDEDLKYYVAKTTPDLKTSLDKLVDVLTQVKTALDKTASALTALDTAGFLIAATSGVPSPPVAATDISGITSASTSIDTLKTQLTTLKGNLR